MRTSRILPALGVLCLLGLGALVSQLSPRLDGRLSLGFDEWIWRTRRADLMVQLGLMFVGALGIRALLPGEDQGEETDG